MVFSLKDRQLFRYLDLSFVFIIIALIVACIEFRYRTKYLLVLTILIGFVGAAIGPNWYRAWWDKKYSRDYTPKKDLKRVIFASISVLLICLALLSQVVFQSFIAAIIFLVIASVPLIYILIYFFVEDYRFSQHLTKKRYGFLWFLLGLLAFAIIMVIRYRIFQ